MFVYRRTQLKQTIGYLADRHTKHDEEIIRTEAGPGECNYKNVFSILKEKNYSGWITVEQNGPMGRKTARECAKASREFIRQGLGV